MNTLHITRSAAAAAAVCGSLTFLPAAEAVTVLYDIDFSSLTQVPEDWEALSPANNLAGWKLQDDGYGYVRSTSPQTNGGVSVYAGEVDGDIDASLLSDFTVDAFFWKSSTAGSNFTGVVARAQDADNYYTAFVNASNQLYIRRVSNGANSDLVVATLSKTYVADEVWRLTFTVVGNKLEAKAYDEQGNLAGSAAATDSTFTAGTFGLRVQTSAPGYGLFESLTVLSVEEENPILVANPPSGHIFDLGEFDLGESIVLPGEIVLSNEGSGSIIRQSFNLTGSGLFDIQGLIREGTTITPDDPHVYDIAFFGSVTPGVYEAVATFVTTEGEISYTLRATVVPEPAALSLLGVAGMALLSRRSRRKD